MWHSEWAVLVVDDEPDVLRLTKLVLKNMEVYGVPVAVYTANSKAQAIQVIESDLSDDFGPGMLVVALIDVVMETDSAGLELCDYIRNVKHNSIAQIYIRTGQPGIAPERDVIDRYDISGYFTKVETTEDKLYMLVKSGVRQFTLMGNMMTSLLLINQMIAASAAPRELIGKTMEEKLSAIVKRPDADDPERERMAIWVGGELAVCIGYKEAQARASRSRLEQMPGMPLGPLGDVGMIDGTESFIQVAETSINPPVYFLADGYAAPGNPLIPMIHASVMRSMGTLWAQAKQRDRAAI